MFIVIEGIDGSGKTTVSRLLASYLRRRNYSVFLTFEPTDGPIGKVIRNYLSSAKERDLVYEALLFAADRRWHVVNVISPALKKYDFVISDRYVYSSYAYQQSEDTPLDWLVEINRGIIVPNVAVFLDVMPEECIRRLKNKSASLTLLENIDTLRRTYENYMYIVERFNMIKVNANKPPNNVLSDILKILNIKG